MTIPAEVRKHLGLQQADKISFVIEDAGKVEIKVPTEANPWEQTIAKVTSGI